MGRRTYSFFKALFKLRNLMIKKDDQAASGSLEYWQQIIFINLIISFILLGLPVVISGSYQFFLEKMIAPAVALPSIYLSLLLLGFLSGIPYRIRQSLVSWMLYTVSILLLVVTGPRGAGQLYIPLAIVLVLVFSKTHSSGRIVLINALVFTALSFLFNLDDHHNLLFLEFGRYWWLIAINALTVSIITAMIIRMVFKGMERRFIKSQFANKQLIIAQHENVRQINMQNRLRQSSMVLMDSRLDFEERIHTVLESLKTETQCSHVSLALSDNDLNAAVCIAALPEGIYDQRVVIPSFQGPYLEYASSELNALEESTPLMKRAGLTDYYYGCRFFTSETSGYLELLRSEKADHSTLNYLQFSIFQLSSALTNEQLIHNIKKSRDILELSYDEILQAWARILELRDIETQGHSRRVVSICLNIARKVNLSEYEQIQLKRGAFLHDIGKLGIPDRILKKEGPLDDDEWRLMRRHPEIGRDSVINIPFLIPAVPVIYHHHERWDGNGYPSGLKGEDIPLAARIFILADVYDALISDRPYREAMEKEEIITYMLSERGTYFDPELLDSFLEDIDDLTSYREMGDFLKA